MGSLVLQVCLVVFCFFNLVAMKLNKLGKMKNSTVRKMMPKEIYALMVSTISVQPFCSSL